MGIRLIRYSGGEAGNYSEGYHERECYAETSRDEAGTITDSRFNQLKLRFAIYLVKSIRGKGEVIHNGE